MKYTEHTTASVHGFEIADATAAENSIPDRDHDDLVWVGCHGEGKWLTATQTKELAAAILQVTAAHELRRATDAAAQTQTQGAE
jgi:hypothetical protein